MPEYFLMNRDLPRRPGAHEPETWPERVLDVLRRILFPGAQEPELVPVRVPVREPVIRRRG